MDYQATSSYLTSIGSGIISSSEQLPVDLISGSAQIKLGFVSSSERYNTNWYNIRF